MLLRIAGSKNQFIIDSFQFTKPPIAAREILANEQMWVHDGEWLRREELVSKHFLRYEQNKRNASQPQMVTSLTPQTPRLAFRRNL